MTWNTVDQDGTYRVDVYNMPVATTASHIHAGAVGAGGPVVVNFVVPGAGAISNDFGFSGTFGCSDVVTRASQGINSVRGLRAGSATRTTPTRTCTDQPTRAAKSAAADQTVHWRQVQEFNVQGYFGSLDQVNS